MSNESMPAERHSDLQTLLPETLTRVLQGSGSTQLESQYTQFNGSVMMADISGFTTLAERLSHEGSDGLEQLNAVVDAYFARIMGIIHDHGGDLLKMAGDAMVVFWQEYETIAEPAIAAARCALTIQETCHELEVLPGERLSISIGLSHGPLNVFLVGEMAGRWEFLARGESLFGMIKAQKLAEPGQVVIHQTLQDQLPNEGLSLETGAADEFSILKSIQGEAIKIKEIDMLPYDPRLESFISELSRHRLSVPESAWQAEMRRVTVLFIHIPVGPPDDMIGDLETITDWMSIFVDIISRYGGAIKEWIYEDQFITPLVVFGLPSMSHEDDAARGIHVAFDVAASLKSFGVNCSIGVATGKAFLGAVGNDRRKEFALVGEVLNTASRLSHHEEASILCDEATRLGCEDRFQFESLGKITPKGWTEPIEVFKPLKESQARVSREIFVGHRKELQTLLDALQLQAAGEGTSFWLEADPGMGKSSLVREMIHHAERLGSRILLGKGESIHHATPYHAWRPLLRNLIGVQETDSKSRQIEQVESVLSAKFRWRSLAPLLSDILRLGVEDNHLTEQMVGKIRAFNTSKLICEILAHLAEKESLVLILEDAHWMDSASLELIAAVSEMSTSLVMLLTSRLSSQDSTVREQIKDLQVISLQPLSEKDCETLLAARLGANSLEPALLQFIYVRTKGIPLYCIELGYALQNNDSIQTAGGVCRLKPGIDMQSMHLPENLQAVIAERIDHLDTEIQMTAKVAAIIGDTFVMDLLEKVYPGSCDGSKLREHVAELMQSHLVDQNSEDSESQFQFSHAVIKDAIYGMVVSSQRKALHASIAAEMENLEGTGKQTLPQVLAHHWLSAGEHIKAAHYFGTAADIALKEGAYRESLDFSTQAVTLLEKELSSAPAVLDAEENTATLRGKWIRLKAEALLGLGELPQSVAAFHEAVAALEGPDLESRSEQDIIGGGESWLSLRDGMQQNTSDSDQKTQSEVAMDLSLAYEKLGVLYLFSCLPHMTLSAAYHSLHYALNFEENPVRPRSMALLSLAFALISRMDLAEAYAEWATSEAQGEGADGTLGRVNEFLSMWYMGHGKWEESASMLENCRKTFSELGDRRFLIECSCLYSTNNHYLGRYKERVNQGQKICELGVQSGDVQAQSWGVLDQIESLLTLNDLDEVARIGLPLLDQIGVSIFGCDVIMTHGLLAKYYLQRGELPEAVKLAELGLEEISAVEPTIVYNLEAYAGVATVLIEAARASGQDDANFQAAISRAEAACEEFKKFAQVFPIGRARHALLMGRLAHARGEADEALRLTQQAFKESMILTMDFEKALALRQLAEFETKPQAARDSLKEQAFALFDSLGASSSELNWLQY